MTVTTIILNEGIKLPKFNLGGELDHIVLTYSGGIIEQRRRRNFCWN